MPPTIAYSFGDVVLVPFPFTDQSGGKRRPAVVVNSAAYGRVRPDVVLMAITSQGRAASMEVGVAEWHAAGLLKPSVVKPVLTTVEKRLILRRLGRLRQGDADSVRRLLRTVLPFDSTAEPDPSSGSSR